MTAASTATMAHTCNVASRGSTYVGTGTDAYPNSTYLEKFGIRYMNAIAIVMDGGEPESQMLILKEAHKHNV